ncbi:MAG: TolA-binding protein [Glaciecola sp.]|jgi:TolA-binding protein
MIFKRSVIALCLAGCLSPALHAHPQQDAEEQYRFIAGLYSEGHWDMTVKEAKAFLAEHAEHAKSDLARYRLASALFELDRKQEAADQFRPLAKISRFEFHAECNLRLGQCELQAGRSEAAKSALQTARNGSKDYLKPLSAFLLGEACFDDEQYSSARTFYADSVNLDPKAGTVAHALRGQAWCAFRLGDFEATASKVSEFKASQGEHELADEMRYLLGQTLLAAGKHQGAQTAFGEVKQGAFHDACLRGKAFSRAALGDHAGAASAFSALLEAYPKSPLAAEARLQCGAHWLEAGDARAAMEVLTPGSQGKGPELLFWLAKAASQAETEEAGLTILDRALAAKPEGPLLERINSLRGELLYKLGRHDESAAAFASATSDYALHAAASAHLAAGRPADALKSADLLLNQFADSTYRIPTAVTRAEALFALNRPADAFASFEQLWNLEGLDDGLRCQSLSRMAWCRYSQKNAQEAGQLFELLERTFSDSPLAVEALYMAGRCALDDGDKSHATALWTQYLERFDGQEHMDSVLLGLSHAGQGTQSLEDLLDRNPNSPLAHSALFEWARQLEAAGDNAGAAQRYQQLLKDHSDSEHATTARYSLGWCLNSLERYTDASLMLKELLAADVERPMQTAARELLAWSLIESGDKASALTHYTQLLKTDLSSARKFAACKKLALAYKADASPKQALALLRPFAEDAAAPHFAVEALVESAWISLDAGKPLDAEQMVRAATELAANDATVSEAAFFVAEAHFDAKDFERATSLYGYAAGSQGSPVAAQALYKLGFARLSVSDPTGAAKAFGRLTSEHSTSPLYGESLYLQGEAHMRAGDLQAAITPLREVRSSQPKHAILPKALFRLGLALQQTGQAKEGLEVLSQLVGKFADFEAWVEAELNRGLCLVDLERSREARGAFDRVLAKDKGILSAIARIQIGRLHLAQEDDDSALAEFLKVSLLYAHDEEVAEAMFLAGHCLELQDSLDAAIRQYREAIKDHPRAVYAKHCADRLRVLGQ